MTSSTMAVLERLDLALVQELLEAATGSGGELRTVVFENQVVQRASVPDARISARFTWWFEMKTARGSYATEGHDREQLRLHAAHLKGDPDARLFVITPDATRPKWFDELDGIDEAVRDQVLWLSFRDLADSFTQAIMDPTRLLGEQTKFLLNELITLFEADGLLTTDDTVVVAARSAWPEYLQTGAYICQPHRSFRDGLTHFGFYADGAIQPLILRIRAHYPAVVFTHDNATAQRDSGEIELADLIVRILDAGDRVEGDAYGVLFLTGPTAPETVRIDAAIINDVTTASGRDWAWTLGQRYTRLERLREATRTSQL